MRIYLYNMFFQAPPSGTRPQQEDADVSNLTSALEATLMQSLNSGQSQQTVAAMFDAMGGQFAMPTDDSK